MTSFSQYELKDSPTDQREYIRVSSPASVVIENSFYRVKDWSLGGCNIESFQERVKVGDCLPIQFNVGVQEGCTVSTKTLAEVVWVVPSNRDTGVRFLNLTAFEKELLKGYIKQILEARETGQTLTSSVADVDETTTTPQLAPVIPERQRRNPKVILSSLALLAFGTILGYYTLSGLRHAIATIKVESAVISQPIEPVSVTDNGTISQVNVQEGTEVTAGEPLFSISNEDAIEREKVRLNELIRNQSKEVEDIKQKIEFSRLDLADARLELQKAEALEAQERNRINPQTKVAENRLQSAQAELQALQTQYQVAQDSYQRFQKLRQEGAVSLQVVDDKRAVVADLQGKIQTAQAEIQIAETALEEAISGNSLDRNRFIGNLPTLRVEKENAREKIQLNLQEISTLEQFLAKQQQKLVSLETQRESLENPANFKDYSNVDLVRVYNAPVSGSVAKVIKSTGNSINKNEDLILLKHDLEQPIIKAYLAQTQGSFIYVGSQATVRLPNSENTYSAEVIEIDRSGGFTDSVQGLYQLQGSPVQPVYVELKILDDAFEDEPLFAFGTPVILEIQKNLDLVESFKSFSRSVL